ncbi:MAG: hypothetical protein FJ291_14075 [Planctomycetes bacterium]|nr:hypothetical protein [Planctomycetota bacterium]
MNARMWFAWVCVVAALCGSGLAASPPPPGPPPPPAGGAPGPGAVRCHKCNGTGYRWDDRRWKPCNECNGTGWVYPRMRRHGGWYGPWRHRDHDGCFVATAAYGTPWEANVAKLRTFRDECLLSSPVGQGFVSLYYAASPPLARYIAERPWARAATRVALTPAVTLAGALTGNLADMGIVAAAVAIGFVGLPRLRRALRRRRGAASTVPAVHGPSTLRPLGGARCGACSEPPWGATG